MSLLFLLSVLAIDVQAQSDIVKSLERNVPGQGKVTTHQGPRVATLLGNVSPSTGEQKILKSSGYWIQTYVGNNTRQAKNETHNVGFWVKEYFPELSVYISFNPPRWSYKIGDLHSIKGADTMMRKLRATGMFKEVSIARG